jgi:hypothetical protein
LILKDIWELRHIKQSLPVRIYVNPFVKVFYTRGTVLLQRFLVDPLSFLTQTLLRVSLMGKAVVYGAGSDADDSVTCTKFDECMIEPPLSVNCGT